MEAEGSKGQ